jgi:hypothetical protein
MPLNHDPISHSACGIGANGNEDPFSNIRAANFPALRAMADRNGE